MPRKSFGNGRLYSSTALFILKEGLHKDHIQHIEAALVERATRNKRCLLNNDVTPKKPSLPESVLFEAQDLLNDIYHVVPLLGISAFEMVVADANGSKTESLIISSKGIRTTGFVSNSCIGLRDSLVQQGVLNNVSDPWIFTQDYTFESPSMAASAVLGRSANGRIEWRTKDGITLKQIQEAD
jgi:hypothetical protein